MTSATEMTPKEAYEARKAARKSRNKFASASTIYSNERQDEMEDLMDRFVTAIERIADALENK